MATYRRIIEIDAGEGESIFKTVRVDVPSNAKSKRILNEFLKILQGHQGSYETQVIFKEPREGQTMDDYFPRQPGEELHWDWLDEDYKEI